MSPAISPVAIPKPAQVGLVLLGAAAAVVTGRLLRKRSSTPSERLGSALLDTNLLADARTKAHSQPELALTACAGYVAQMLLASIDSAGLARSGDGLLGSSLKSVHPYSGARSSVLVQATRPEETLVYTLNFDGVCNLRGVRTVGPVRLNDVTPSRKVRDQVQFDLGEAHAIQIESNLKVADYVATGSNRIQGEMALEDSRGCAGSLTVMSNGTVTGSVTSGGKTIGRFAGSMAQGIHFVDFRNPAVEGDAA